MDEPRTNTSMRILVVEDEETLAVGLEYALAREGFQVAVARDGEAALKAVQASTPDLVLLDVMLPRRSGFEVLKTLREKGRAFPVILLTAKGQEVDKVRGLDLGADDYVTKPFGLAELLARIRARLRTQKDPAETLPEKLTLGGALLDLRALTVRRGKKTEALTVREADMLRLLWRERGQAVSRARFLEEVWGHERFPTTRTVDQHIAKLRGKVEADPASPRHILTVFGLGYRLEP
jgi:DNA-binding response OmpR family regulator